MEPLTLKSESSLWFGLLMFIVLEEVNSGGVFYCLTSPELGV